MSEIAIKLLMAGFIIGVLGGMLGIGGGVLVIPALVLLLHFSQQRAVGTSLAMLLPPIGIFAVLRFWRMGQVDWRAAMLLAASFAPGALVGAWIIGRGWISERGLRLIFVAFMLYVAGNMLFRGERRVWATLTTVGIAIIYGISYMALRLLGRKWEHELCLPDVYRERLDRAVAPDYEI